MFYYGGTIIIVKGLLISFGVDLPRRDGTIANDLSAYSLETILFGIFIICMAFIISRKDTK